MKVGWWHLSSQYFVAKFKQLHINFPLLVTEWCASRPCYLTSAFTNKSQTISPIMTQPGAVCFYPWCCPGVPDLWGHPDPSLWTCWCHHKTEAEGQKNWEDRIWNPVPGTLYSFTDALLEHYLEYLLCIIALEGYLPLQPLHYCRCTYKYICCLSWIYRMHMHVHAHCKNKQVTLTQLLVGAVFNTKQCTLYNHRSPIQFKMELNYR